jgi:serine/threonine protein kinase
MDTGRNLLFGLLALQNHFIDRDALLGAFNTWLADRSRALGQVLLERGALSPSRHGLLEALVAEHIRLHGDDPEQSLAALSSIGSVRNDLSQVADPELQHSLAHVSAARQDQDDDPYRTVAQSSVGDSTSAGTRFRILRPHAKGGLGEVFVALDTELNRDVALKEIQDHLADDPRYRARFEFEAEVTGGLEHPGIVPVYGLGHTADGRPFYAMRFIRGNSLKEAVRRFHSAEREPGRDPGRSTLDLRELLGRFMDVCDAVAYAHSRGVLHRDLKPGNIMLGKYGETLVVDWGLAKALDQPELESPVDRSDLPLRPSAASSLEQTQAGSAVGTPAYMSPEQAEGRLDLLGPRSDVYCLGATLYHLLTGRAPCEAEQVGEVYEKIRAGDIPRPRSLNQRVAPALEAICLKALALKPGDRYESAQVLKLDLERWLADEPVTAWGEPFSLRVRRWARRNRTAVTGAAAALVVGIIGLSAVAVVQSRAKSALEAKNRQLIEAKNEAETALAETMKAQAEMRAALMQSEKSRRQAEAAERMARSEADKAKAVNDFLTEDLLTQAEPANNAPEDHVSLLEVLDRAADKVGDRFASQPEVEDALRRAIAGTYHGLASWEKAERQWWAVLDAARRRFGGESREALTAQGELAHILRHRGRIDADMLEMAKSAGEGLARVLGPDHPDALTSRDNLAIAYLSAGRIAEAIKLHEGTLALQKTKRGPDHRDTLASRNNLALAYWSAGRTAEAINLHEGTLRLCEARLGPDHPDTLTSRNNLAAAYSDAGRTDEAIKIHEATLRLEEAKLGPDHPNTLISRNNLATTYYAAGRVPEAVPIFEATLKLQETKLGFDHPNTLISRNNLAGTYLAAGRATDAIKLHEGTLKLRESKLGPDHPDTLVSRNNLATAYLAAGRESEAVPIFEATLKLRESKLGFDHRSTLISRGSLAAAYESLGRWPDAEALRRDTVARRRKAEKPDSPLLGVDLADLGRNLLNQEKWSEAEPLLRESLAIRAKATPEEWRRYDTMSQFGGSLLGQGRYVEAEPLASGLRRPEGPRGQAPCGEPAPPGRGCRAGRPAVRGVEQARSGRCMEAEARAGRPPRRRLHPAVSAAAGPFAH